MQADAAAPLQPTNLDLAPALAVAKSALLGLPKPEREPYSALMESRVSAPLADLAEELMNRPLSDDWKRYVPAWYPELREQILNEGIEQGIEQGIGQVRTALIELVADRLTAEQLAHAKPIGALDELTGYLKACTRPLG